ncbi:ABC transporter substrate-binding protein [Pseudoroseomonas cervicalis]|uniref:ABC transporter substrate-binding protein n=1 Tax=Teichococcus cervicalis TaxID=204525 RepID=UPI0027807FAB|nr:ABC transporter substrate-binding protein [Pseudoroseomonas cervicalis]MDQ1078076.1 iron complex transport system substrate-binding protein [Pseudoroseomonas cervicalis]
MNRRSLLRGLAPLPLVPLAAPRLARAQAPIALTDLAGRQLVLPRPARRLVLVQGRHVLALALLHPDPVSLVVGWGDDLRRMNPPDYAALRARFPAADAVPVVARAQGEGLSLEGIIAAAPDLVVFSPGALRRLGPTLPDRLQSLGIPGMAIDFFDDPMRNTRPSIALLGRALGLEERARAFDAFYAEGRQAVAERLAGLAERPTILVHAHAGGTPCCSSPGQGAFDSMIRFAGGHNIGADLLPGSTGELALEYVLGREPQVYLATGGPYAGRGGIPFGPGVTPQAARDALAEVVRREKLDRLAAVRQGRAHAIWHGFNDTPAHLLMLQALARWLHPERCADLDPAATLAALNERFLSVKLEGSLWVDLPAATTP